jgi:hypothetical protein
MSDDWTHIWLEHKDAELTPEGRSWCDHDAWGDGAVEYIRADIAAARIAELEADNARLREGVAQLGRMWEANQDLLAESKEIDFLFEHTARIKELEAYVARIDEAAQNAIEALRATGSAWPMNAGKALKKAMQDAADLKRSP